MLTLSKDERDRGSFGLEGPGSLHKFSFNMISANVFDLDQDVGNVKASYQSWLLEQLKENEYTFTGNSVKNIFDIFVDRDLH